MNANESKPATEDTRPVTHGLCATPKKRGLAQLARVTTGVVLLPVGIALLVLPGPGIPIVAASLALLRSEFRWADQAWHKLGTVARRGMERLRERGASS